MAHYRKFITIALSFLVLACLYAVVFHFVTLDSAQAMRAERPELEWLRQEYDLTDDQFLEVRAKHETHDIICRDLCRRLVEARKRLDRVVSHEDEKNASVTNALEEWTILQKQCRDATITYIFEVSALLSKEDARRYRERIFQQVIIPGQMPHVDEYGEFHEKFIDYAAPASSVSQLHEDD